LKIEPSKYVPFQNAKLTDGKYLLVKKVIPARGGSRLEESFGVEILMDSTNTTVVKTRPKSSLHFDQ